MLKKFLNDPFYFTPENPDGIRAVRLEHEAAWTLAQMERNGFPFDKESAEKLYMELAAERSDLLIKLVKTFGTWWAPDKGTEPFPHPKTGRPMSKYQRQRQWPKLGKVMMH